MALKADIVVKGPNGERSIKADDFFVDIFTTALQPGELVTELRFAIPPAHTGSAYIKLENKASHYAVVGCAAGFQLIQKPHELLGERQRIVSVTGNTHYGRRGYASGGGL